MTNSGAVSDAVLSTTSRGSDTRKTGIRHSYTLKNSPETDALTNQTEDYLISRECNW